MTIKNEKEGKKKIEFKRLKASNGGQLKPIRFQLIQIDMP
jgi:hypothetical protein